MVESDKRYIRFTRIAATWAAVFFGLIFSRSNFRFLFLSSIKDTSRITSADDRIENSRKSWPETNELPVD